MSSYFVIHVYGPCALIVIISWITFVLPRSSPPARVTLGVTSVLTVVTILNLLNNSMPKVKYERSLINLTNSNKRVKFYYLSSKSIIRSETCYFLTVSVNKLNVPFSRGLTVSKIILVTVVQCSGTFYYCNIRKTESLSQFKHLLHLNFICEIHGIQRKQALVGELSRNIYTEVSNLFS